MRTHGYRQRSPHRRDGLSTVYCPGYAADRTAFYWHGKSCRVEEHRKTLSKNNKRKAWTQSIEYIPGLETPLPMREHVEDCAHTDQRLPVIQRQQRADIGVQYSATMNVRDLPSRLRTSLICIVALPMNTTGSAIAAFLEKLTHCKRNLRSMCLVASRRKPAPPVV